MYGSSQKVLALCCLEKHSVQGEVASEFLDTALHCHVSAVGPGATFWHLHDSFYIDKMSISGIVTSTTRIISDAHRAFIKHQLTLSHSLGFSLSGEVLFF